MVPVEFDIIVFKENDTYVSYCPELDVSSCGDSIERAKQMLKTAVRLFLEEANYVKDSSGKWIPPKLVATEMASI